MSRLPDDIVWQDNGDWVVDPELVAPKLGLSAEAFREAMRDGQLTSLVERGEGEDAGRTRLTFRYGTQAWALRIEPDGTAFETPAPIDPQAVPAWLQGQGSL